MIETPVVIHLAQRPGPATGLPTRTEQGDLELALYAGHGEFPRAIYAPGTLEDLFEMSRRAFDLADKAQSPVIILTDQYLMDSYYNFKKIDVTDMKTKPQFIETDTDYRRYEITDDGISPRGIPGYGKGLVVVDSDEHDEQGHITEDLGLRVKMTDKRLKKLDLLIDAVAEPELTGKQDSEYLLVCWGSTVHGIREALDKLGRDDISLLYFKQVFPLPKDTASYFENIKKSIVIESNATSQFGKLLKLNADIRVDGHILKYNGMQFSVEELTEKIDNACK
jgi:2-oxoglutarate ferredoxin oxidoreductase subunit alpha